MWVMVNCGRGYRMCDEGARMGLPYVRQGNMDRVTVCATRECGWGCHMCDKGTRTGLPYVQQGNADGVAVCVSALCIVRHHVMCVWAGFSGVSLVPSVRWVGSVRLCGSHVIVFHIGRKSEIWKLLHEECISLIANGVRDNSEWKWKVLWLSKTRPWRWIKNTALVNSKRWKEALRETRARMTSKSWWYTNNGSISLYKCA